MISLTICMSQLTVSVFSWHCSGPGSTGQSPGPQSSNGLLAQLVSGVYFFTLWRLELQTLLGHLVHFCSVV